MNVMHTPPARCARGDRLVACPTKRGFTLYEVFLALTLLLGALAVLNQHVATGVRASVSAKRQTRAEVLATTKLNEVLAGVEPLTAVDAAPLESGESGDTGAWTWTMTVAPGPYDGLLDVAVTVQHTDENRVRDAFLTVRQYARDPAVFLSEPTGGTP